MNVNVLNTKGTAPHQQQNPKNLIKNLVVELLYNGDQDAGKWR